MERRVAGTVAGVEEGWEERGGGEVRDYGVDDCWVVLI
jgi:hypothetical protein